MTLAVRRSIASVGAATLLFSGGAVLLAAHAGAATTPPWESSSSQDANEVGTLALYNSSGTQVTSGSITASPIAAYVVGSTADASDTKATLYAYTPKFGVDASGWSGEQLSPSTTYPVTAAGAPSVVTSATGPVVTGAAGQESLKTYIADFPNKDTKDSGYVNAYQLRVKTSSDGGSTNGTYQSLDIFVSGNTWVETYPTAHPLKATSTKLTASPTSVKEGKKVTLKAVESITAGGHASGKIQFKAGTKNLGGPVTVSASGAATRTTTALLPGKRSITATFTPTAAATYASSVSAHKTVKVIEVALANKAKPMLSNSSHGAAKVGTKESVTKGKWSPKATSYKYQWYIGSKKIKHATKSSLKLTKKDAGKKLTCVVTAHRAHYKAGSARSKGVKVKK